jgi:hypothetical protein
MASRDPFLGIKESVLVPNNKGRFQLSRAKTVMVSNPFPLEQIRIASPCSANWSDMQGDEHVRFCKECHKNVYNLSSMSRPEAEALLEEVEGDSCVRLYRRVDSTVITDDCPVAVRRVRRAKEAIYWTIASTSTGLAMIVAAVVGQDSDKQTDSMSALRRIEPFATVINWIWPGPPAPPPRSECTMGALAPRGEN